LQFNPEIVGQGPQSTAKGRQSLAAREEPDQAVRARIAVTSDAEEKRERERERGGKEKVRERMRKERQGERERVNERERERTSEKRRHGKREFIGFSSPLAQSRWMTRRG